MHTGRSFAFDGHDQFELSLFIAVKNWNTQSNLSSSWILRRPHSLWCWWVVIIIITLSIIIIRKLGRLGRTEQITQTSEEFKHETEFSKVRSPLTAQKTSSSISSNIVSHTNTLKLTKPEYIYTHIYIHIQLIPSTTISTLWSGTRFSYSFPDE